MSQSGLTQGLGDAADHTGDGKIDEQEIVDLFAEDVVLHIGVNLQGGGFQYAIYVFRQYICGVELYVESVKLDIRMPILNLDEFGHDIQHTGGHIAG